MPSVQLRDLRWVFRDAVALQEFRVDAASHEFVSLLGRSGREKITALRIVAGFEYPDSVGVPGDGKDVLGLPATAGTRASSARDRRSCASRGLRTGPRCHLRRQGHQRDLPRAGDPCRPHDQQGTAARRRCRRCGADLAFGGRVGVKLNSGSLRTIARQRSSAQGKQVLRCRPSRAATPLFRPYAAMTALTTLQRTIVPGERAGEGSESAYYRLSFGAGEPRMVRGELARRSEKPDPASQPAVPRPAHRPSARRRAVARPLRVLRVPARPYRRARLRPCAATPGAPRAVGLRRHGEHHRLASREPGHRSAPRAGALHRRRPRQRAAERADVVPGAAERRRGRPRVGWPELRGRADGRRGRAISPGIPTPASTGTRAAGASPTTPGCSTRRPARSWPAASAFRGCRASATTTGSPSARPSRPRPTADTCSGPRSRPPSRTASSRSATRTSSSPAPSATSPVLPAPSPPTRTGGSSAGGTSSRPTCAAGGLTGGPRLRRAQPR